MWTRTLLIALLVAGSFSWPDQVLAVDGFQAATWGMSLAEAEKALGCEATESKVRERFVAGAEHRSCRSEVLGYPVVLILAGKPRLMAVRVEFLREGAYKAGPNRAGPVPTFDKHYLRVLGVLRAKYGRDVESKDGPSEVMGYPVPPKVKTHEWPVAGVSLLHEPKAPESLLITYQQQAASTDEL